MDFRRFAYMHWAKRYYFDAELSLVPSGMQWPTREDLPFPEIEPYAEVGYEDPGGLHETIGAAYAIPRDELAACLGSTQAYDLAFSTMLAPGDHIVVESPSYEVFDCLATLRGIRADPFERAREDDFALDVDRVAAALRPETRLVVLTSVHNPSGRLASESQLEALGELCARHDAHALVSECYLDFVDGSTVGPDGSPPRRRRASAIHPRLFSTNSVTKVYGLGSVRCGWISGEASVIRTMWEAREILCPLLPSVPVAITIAALEQRDRLLTRARERAERGRAILRDGLRGADGLRLVEPEAGIMALVELVGLDESASFVTELRERHGVGVVPGEFFDAPGLMRIGYGIDEETLREGLARLCRARAEFSA